VQVGAGTIDIATGLSLLRLVSSVVEGKRLADAVFAPHQG